jgi:predicted GIY-YIG superfamily endonuclease
MSIWTNAVQVGENFDAIKQFKQERGIYRFSISQNIAYPKEAGKIVYIGSSGNLGERIAQHLKKSDRESLRAYINSGNKIFVSVKRPRANKKKKTYLKSMKTDALEQHVNEYGMIPICNN